MNSKHPKTIQAPPFCIDCSNFIPAAPHNENLVKPILANDAPRCRAAEMMDLVTGKKFYPFCHDMRSDQAPCGTVANLFRPNDDLDKPATTDGPSAVESEGQGLN